MTDLRDAQSKGFIAKTPHYNSIFNYLENPELTPLLKSLIAESSLPLSSVETNFAADSSGFMTSRFTRWFDHKYGHERAKADWVKCHVMCSVKTNIITAVEIHGQHAADTKMLPALTSTTAMNFTMHEVSADKGYASKANYDSVARFGAVPFISFQTIIVVRAAGNGPRCTTISTSASKSSYSTTTSVRTSNRRFQ